MATVIDHETGEHEYESGSSSDALMALSSAEIDTQIRTAKAYPRSIKMFVREATEMVTLTEEIATECMYALKRQGKTIEGPSARFAEVICSAWGNCRAGARQIAEDDRFVTAQGAFLDLQRNVAITYEVKRRITDKHGHKYSDDMVGVTSNAASSISLRNAVLKGIPKAFWKPIYDAARKTAVGDAETLVDRRSKMLAYFQKMGVTELQIITTLEVAGVEDINLDQLAVLKGIATAIKDGDTTVDQAFAPAEPVAGSRVKKSDLGEKLPPKTAKETKSDAGREPPQSDELAADLVRFQERCDKAVTIQEVTEADAALRGETGRQLTDTETEVADKAMADALKRIRGSRGERSNAGGQKELGLHGRRADRRGH